MWKNFVREYLSFTKNQRRGLYFLLLIIVICIGAPFFFPYFSRTSSKEEAQFKKEVAAFLKMQESSINVKKADTVKEIKLFYFDPNKLSKEDWQRLGISKKVTRIIFNYKDAGGRFFEKEDLKKIYGLSTEDYNRLYPYIRIEKEPLPEKIFKNKTAAQTDIPKRYPSSPKKELMIDINLADSAEWNKLYGIGPVLSSRIVRYRNALGGFHHIEQVAEVYHLPDSTFQSIKPHLLISDVSLEKLDINSISIEKLVHHPYINYHLAKSIVAYRQMHGKFRSLQQLKELQLVDDQIYRKIAPYLTVK